MVTASIRSGIKSNNNNVAIPSIRSVGLRNYSGTVNGSTMPCTNSVRKTLYSTSNYGTRQSRLSNPHPSSLIQNYGPSRFTPVIRRGFANSASQANNTTTTTVAAPAKKSSGMMDKIKDLVRKYGYTGVAVYLGISTIDLAATFVVVKALGMEKIERAQDWVVDHVGTYFGYKRDPNHRHSHDGEGNDSVIDLDKVDDEQVGAIYNKASGLWSVFLIAYGIHKLLVPFRVVATSMITPPLVKWFIKRGWMKETAKKGAVAAGSTSAKVASEVAKP
ncbi:hypothetical protein BGZ80_011516 [Entomortierella chlamydospora]|uniref:DUF1279 domain-containing protein n=1 Tax=Entomortierella chlamydospora TaxID=101097 RepID=A0A9P6MTA1_9FUNG|nr:hypothetical protein BGZ80_011516 [Entomortierella chlamydospora]